MDDKRLNELQKKLGYKFKDKSMLRAALTHSSYANEIKKSGVVSNERLEFLGDSVLGMTVAAFIYNEYPSLHEGKMTKLRADLVCEKNLVTLAAKFSIGEYILLGRGEEKGGGRERPSMLADAVEAIIAAIYLDGGFKSVTKFIKEHFTPQAQQMQARVSDYKTALQEVAQEKENQQISYSIIDESGPDHQKSFTVEVRFNGVRVGEGTGKSKKNAEQMAAKAALEKLKEDRG